VTAAERLEAIEEIRRLKARYFRYVDTKEWERWGALFVADCRFHDRAGDFRCAGRDELLRKVSAALDGVISIHQGSMPEIEVEDADNATGVWTMSDYLQYPAGKSFQSQDGTVRVRGYGHYVERYRREAGQWRFAEVTVSRLHLEYTGHLDAVHPRILAP
jgi:hypothetical protein